MSYQICLGPTAISRLVSVCTRSCRCRGWCRHEVQVDHFKPEPDDPLHEPPESSLIRQLGAKGCRAGAHDNLAVIKFRAQGRTSLTREGDLIGSGSHQDYASQSAAQAHPGALRLVNREIYRLVASYPRYHHRPLLTLCSLYACAGH
jgi:hypothetical protein